MSYIASNGGLTIIWHDAGYVLQSGEVDMGSAYPTDAEIAAQFPAAANARAWEAYQAQACAALADSDLTMHRLTEAVSIGATTLTAADVVAFVQWRIALRAILSQAQPATIPSSLPAKPAYPAGT